MKAKGLLRKVLAPLIFAGALLTTPVYSKSISLSASFGEFIGTSQAMQDIYGPMAKIRVALDSDVSKNFRFETALSYIKGEGNPYVYTSGIDSSDITASSNLSIVRSETIGYLMIPIKPVTLRAGLGIILGGLFESLTANAYGETASAETTKSLYGSMVVLGIDVAVNKNLSVFGEISGSYIPIEDAFGNQADIGGSSADIGFKYKIYNKM